MQRFGHLQDLCPGTDAGFRGLLWSQSARKLMNCGECRSGDIDSWPRSGAAAVGYADDICIDEEGYMCLKEFVDPHNIFWASRNDFWCWKAKDSFVRLQHPSHFAQARPGSLSLVYATQCKSLLQLPTPPPRDCSWLPTFLVCNKTVSCFQHHRAPLRSAEKATPSWWPLREPPPTTLGAWDQAL